MARYWLDLLFRLAWRKHLLRHGERYMNEATFYHIARQMMARRQREHGDASLL